MANKRQSRLLLRDYVHFCNLDIVGFFYLPGSNAYLSTEQMRDLKLSTDELQTAACKNTLSRFGIAMANTADYSRSFPEGTILQSEPFASVTFNPQGLYLLTNEDPDGGAALMLMPPVLEMLGNMLGGDYYITPRSTREVLISSIEYISSKKLDIARIADQRIRIFQWKRQPKIWIGIYAIFVLVPAETVNRKSFTLTTASQDVIPALKMSLDIRSVPVVLS